MAEDKKAILKPGVYPCTFIKALPGVPVDTQNDYHHTTAQTLLDKGYVKVGDKIKNPEPKHITKQ